MLAALRKVGQSSSQAAKFEKTRGHITHNCRKPRQRARFVSQWDDRKFDRDLGSTLGDPGHSEDFAVVVPADAASHDSSITCPVTLSQSVRDNDVQRSANRF